jgi:hypothetical protein
MTSLEPQFDFQGATFDLHDPEDRAIIGFMLSQALYGEATGVYCGKSLYSAHSLEAAKFYVRQARQELNHLEMFADIFRKLDLQPDPPHWAIKLLASHNNYYPLKVLMEHAVGEGMVLDIFRDVLLQTLPDDDERVPDVKKRLRVVCLEEEEHVAWGESETIRLLKESPWLRTPFYGLVELQMMVAPLITVAFSRRFKGHPVLVHVPGFVAHVRARVMDQGRRLGFVPAKRPSLIWRCWAMGCGAVLYVRSQFSRSRSKLDKHYIAELGFGLQEKG